MRRVIGLTGANASGKGEVGLCLSQHGFRLHSLSDVVRDEAAQRGLPPTRENLIRIGNLLRVEGGPGVLAERIVSRLAQRDVVDSIRNPVEVEVLRGVDGFILVGVRAPLEVRLARTVARGRPGDPATLDEFRLREAQENSDDPTAQRLAATFDLCDRVLDNDGDLPRLHQAVRCLLDELDRR